MTLRFDEPELRAQLDSLPRTRRAAFAAACAERLFPAYVRFSREAGRGNPERLRVALNGLWDDLEGSPMPDLELLASAESCLALVPSEDEEPWFESQPSAEDAAASIVYALESRLKDGSQEAAWSARRVYDALDRFLMSDESGMIVTTRAEERVLEHPLMQAELVRQRRDLEELILSADDTEELSIRLRERARTDSAVVFGHTFDTPGYR